jgi:hypothetical protein
MHDATRNDAGRSPSVSRPPPTPLALRLLVAAVFLAGVAAMVTLPESGGEPDRSTLFLLIAVSALAGMWPVRVGPLRVQLTATHPVVMCALVVAGPSAAVLTAMTGLASTVLRRHRTHLSRRLPFNIGAVAVSVAASAWVFEALGGGAARGLESTLWPLLGATTVYFIVNSGLVSVAVALEQGKTVSSVWRESFLWTVASYLSGFTLAALLLVVVGALGPWSLVLAIPPCWLLIGFYRAHKERLSEQQRRVAEVERLNAELERTVVELRQAADHVKRLQGLIPICMHCKSIRDDQKIWRRIEEYVAEHAGVEFTHSLCEACRQEHYSDVPLPASPTQ